MIKWLTNHLVRGYVQATKFITTGGTSSDFVKGDGSLDDNTYVLDSDLQNHGLQEVADIGNLYDGRLLSKQGFGNDRGFTSLYKIEEGSGSNNCLLIETDIRKSNPTSYQFTFNVLSRHTTNSDVINFGGYSHNNSTNSRIISNSLNGTASTIETYHDVNGYLCILLRVSTERLTFNVDFYNKLNKNITSHSWHTDYVIPANAENVEINDVKTIATEDTNSLDNYLKNTTDTLDGDLTVTGQVLANGGNSDEWNEAYDNIISDISPRFNGNLLISRSNSNNYRRRIKSIEVIDTRNGWDNTDGTNNYMPNPDDPNLNKSLTGTFSQDWGGPGWGGVITIKAWTGDYTAWQISGRASGTGGGNFYIRDGSGLNWNAWNRIWHSGDFTQTDINQWNTAYGWGDHSTEGYLTSETDPIFQASPAAGISNTDITNWNAKGVQLTADQPNAKIHLKDSSGNTLSTLDVGFLNNEGTTISFNSTTDEIELRNDEGTLLSSFPAGALMTGVGYGLNLTGSTLELTDSANNVIDSVTLTISNIQGLQTALNGKVDFFSSYISDADTPSNTQDYRNVSPATTNGFNGYGSILSSMGSTYYIQLGLSRGDGLYQRVDKGSWDKLATEDWVTTQNYLTSSDLTPYALKSTNFTAGTGLTGGGTLAANRTFSVDFGTTTGTVAEGNHTHSNLSTGTGLTGSTYNGGTARTFSFDTTWGDNRYALDSHTHSASDITSGVFSYSRLPITSTQVSNWNTAYSWGDHSTEGYLTSNQTITLSGDVSGSGSTAISVTIASSAVEAGMLNNNIISGKTALTSGLSSTDELMISDAGTIKRMDVSVLQSYMQTKLAFSNNSGTVTSVATGTGLTGGTITSTGTISLNASSISSLALADTALQPSDLNGYATENYVDTSISNLIDSSPSTLDTLNELAAALGDDPNFATTVSSQIGLKADKSISINAGTGLTGGGTLAADRTLSVNFGTASGTVARGNDSRFHTHSNKSVLDGISSSNVSNWNGKQDKLTAGDGIAISTSNEISSTVESLFEITNPLSSQPTIKSKISGDVLGNGQIVIGKDATASVGNTSNGIAIGTSSKVSTSAYGAVAIGALSNASHGSSIALGAGAKTFRTNEVSLSEYNSQSQADNKYVSGVKNPQHSYDAANKDYVDQQDVNIVQIPTATLNINIREYKSSYIDVTRDFTINLTGLPDAGKTIVHNITLNYKGTQRNIQLPSGSSTNLFGDVLGADPTKNYLVTIETLNVATSPLNNSVIVYNIMVSESVQKTTNGQIRG